MQEQFSANAQVDNELEARRREREETVRKRAEEGVVRKTLRTLVEKFEDAEDVIGSRDMALFRAAGYVDRETAWISSIKRESDKSYSAGLNAYDLVRTQAILARDFENNRKVQSDDLGEISETSISALDEFLAKILDYYKSVDDARKLAHVEDAASWTPYLKTLFRLLDETKKATTGKEKAHLFTDWLGLVHSGGNKEVLSLFQGYSSGQEMSFIETQRAQQTFLNKLNALGKRQ